jgi:hypothetical protein
MGRDELDLDARAVLLVPLDRLVLHDVGLVALRVDAQLDAERGRPLPCLGEDDDRLARRELPVEPAALMPIPCCPRDCFRRWNFEP